MRVLDILTILPEAGPLIARYGLSCFGCSANAVETLEEGCRSHGMKDDVLQDLVTDLNELLARRPKRPRSLEITETAAITLKTMLEQEGKNGYVLCVGPDARGGFSMDLKEDHAPDDAVFSHPQVPEVRIAAADLTLARIGGAVIDVRDGRFKLDLPEDTAGCACKNGGTCGCE